MPTIAFFDTKPYDQESFNRVNESFGFDITYFAHHLNEQTADLAREFDAVCIFVNDVANRNVAEKLKRGRTKLIALRSAGYNHVELAAVYGAIHVVRVPSYSPHAVAEHAAALMLTLNRKTHKAYSRTRDGNFSINGLLGFDMCGKTAGVIGTGMIGKCTISILNGLGMRVLAHDAFPNAEYAKAAGITYVDLPTLYRESDVISLHCPLNRETYHLINNDALSQMKNGVMIINTGRGKLIDTVAMIKGLKSGKVGSAGLDVYEEESEYFFEDYSASLIGDDVLARLLMFPNVLVTSHQGFFTKEALYNIAEATLRNVKEFFDGGFLENEICYRCDKDCLKKQKKRCF